MRLKNEFASNDPNVIFSYVPFQDDDMERFVEMCSLEMCLLQNVNMNDKVIIIADTRHSQRWSERKVDPTLCNGNLAFFCNCATILESLRLWAHERTPSIPRRVEDLEIVKLADVLGAIAEDHHLTRCAQVCFTGTEEDQAEQHDQGTIDEVLADQDMEERTDVLEEADREADLLEQIPLLGHPESEKERLASWLRLIRRASVAIRRLHRNLRHLPQHLCRCHVLPKLHKIISMLQRHFDVRDATTHKPRPQTQQRITTSTLYVQSRSGSRCVRDR